MSLFDRVKSKIKEDLIIEMNKTGDDDPWDDDKDDKNNNNNNNNKENKKIPPNKKKKFKRTPYSQKAADAASKEARSLSSQIDQSEKEFINRRKNLQKNKASLENTFKQTYKPPSKDKAKEIMNKSVVNQADAGKRAKTFRQSFGTPTGADPKTGKPTYAPSYTVDAKGNKKLGPDIGAGDNMELPKNRGKVPTDKAYEKISKKLGEREAAKKVYLNQNTKRASNKGMKEFIRKSQQMSSGSNVPLDDKQIEKIYKKQKSETARKINQKYGGQRVNLQGTNKFKKIKNILKNKNIGKKAGAVKKFLKPVYKAAMKNKRASLVIGGIGAAATYMGGDALRRKLRGDIGSVKDFTKTAPIVNKSTGKEVRYSYGGTNNTLPKFKNNLARDKYFTSKLKSGQFKVKSK